MKKKKILTEVFVLLFVTALFLCTYVLLEMRTCWWALLGAVSVLLIASYLLIDCILEMKATAAGEPGNGAAGTQTTALLERMEELVNIQKAVYTATKRNGTENQEAINRVQACLIEMDETIRQLAEGVMAVADNVNLERRMLQTEQSMLETLKAYREDVQNGTKMLIKYERENARQIAENAHTNTEMLIIEMKNALEILKGNAAEIFVPQPEPRLQPAEPETLPEPELLPEPEAAAELPETEIPEIEIPEPEILPEPEAAEEPEQKAIADALQDLVTDDPNRALTPEEIAAMFAAVQQ